MLTGVIKYERICGAERIRHHYSGNIDLMYAGFVHLKSWQMFVDIDGASTGMYVAVDIGCGREVEVKGELKAQEILKIIQAFFGQQFNLDFDTVTNGIQWGLSELQQEEEFHFAVSTEFIDGLLEQAWIL